MGSRIDPCGVCLDLFLTAMVFEGLQFQLLIPDYKNSLIYCGSFRKLIALLSGSLFNITLKHSDKCKLHNSLLCTFVICPNVLLGYLVEVLSFNICHTSLPLSPQLMITLVSCIEVTSLISLTLANVLKLSNYYNQVKFRAMGLWSLSFKTYCF